MSSENDVVEPLRKPEVIRVKVDSTEMQKLVESNIEKNKKIAELESQVAESAESKALLNDLKERASLEITALGIPTEVEDIRSKADLDRTVATIKELWSKKDSNSASGGVAPLPQSHGQNEGYGSEKEMIDDLRQRANSGDANAKSALNQLSFKALKGLRKVQVEPYQRPQEQTTSSDLIENGKLVVKPDCLGLGRAYREKKLRAMAQKGDAQALAILNSGDY